MVLTCRRLQFYILLTLILLMMLILGAGKPLQVGAQVPESESDPAVEEIFNALTPNERVGQLFMVSFNGTNTSLDSDIAQLIQQYRIGGVVISAENENFANNESTPVQVLSLVNALQALAQTEPAQPAAESQNGSPTLAVTPTVTSSVESYTPMPLFVATTHEGDGFPHTQIRGGGMINPPSQMALGATWNIDNARMVGEVVGQELSLLGINMLFGPSLDVSDSPRPELGGSLGVRTFGGHPFWVSKMGQAYIQGVHQGSNGQILTIAKHFPGFGSSVRPINQGVPTIIKSLDDLRRTELRPFFKATSVDPNNPADTSGLTDGLMTAHARYRGLQGNVPISLDARNLPTLLTLKEIAPWREAGGLIVSAPLGVPAALEGVAAGSQNFPARRLALDAFLAGSDLLLLVDFAFESDPSAELRNIQDAVEFFREKYATDPNFQTAVDKSVRRIIKAKTKLYGNNFLEADVQKPVDNLALLEDITIDLDQIAQAGVSLITPITQDGLTPLPEPPQPDDNVLIFTDDRVAQDCPTCPEFALIETTALEEIILQLFGPNATGQMLPQQITSLSFADLKEVAGGDATGNESIEASIENADWIIFAMLNIDPEVHPQSDAVRILLRNRFDTLRNKNLVLFAFNAPYFLDATEISQLTAYYAFYGKGIDYLETAARLLFQQFEPGGASPVSIPAIGPLDLSPDPDQLIQLEPIHKIDVAGNIVALAEQSENTTSLDLELGEGILFRTGVIVDRNGNPVPDGTSVDFFRFYPLENLPLEPLTASTTDGVAEITIVKERDTPLQIRASSNLAAQSVTFNIGPGIVDTPTPTVTSTPTPTDTPAPTSTAIPTATPEPTETPTVEVPAPIPTEQPINGNKSPSRPVDIVDLLYSLLGMLVVGGIAFTLGGDRFSLEERVRPALVAVAIGLVGYIIYVIVAMAFPKSGFVMAITEQGSAGHWVAPVISLLFAIAGTVAWFFKPGRISWSMRQIMPARKAEEE